MVKTIIEQASDLLGKEGMKIGPSDWMDVSQKRIDTFADATGDHQWIHVDEEKAKEWSIRNHDCSWLPYLITGCKINARNS